MSQAGRKKKGFSSSKWAPRQKCSELLPAILWQLMTDGAGSCSSRSYTSPRTGWKWKKSRFRCTAWGTLAWLRPACLYLTLGSTIRYLTATVTSTACSQTHISTTAPTVSWKISITTISRPPAVVSGESTVNKVSCYFKSIIAIVI